MKEARSRVALRTPSPAPEAPQASADKLAAIQAMSDVTGGAWPWQNATANGFGKTAHNIAFSPEINAMLEFALEKGLIRSKRSFVAEAAGDALQKLVSQWIREQEILAKAKE